MRPSKRHCRPPATDTPRQSASKKLRKVNASAQDRCNEANTRSSSAPRAPSTQTALEVTSQGSASGPQQHLSISHSPVVNIVSEVQSYRPRNQERSQSIGTTSSTPLNPQSSSSGNPPPQSSNLGLPDMAGVLLETELAYPSWAPWFIPSFGGIRFAHHFSILYCVCLFSLSSLCVFCLMLHVSLDCSFLIAPRFSVLTDFKNNIFPILCLWCI